MRLFVAVSPSAAAVEHLAAAVSEIRAGVSNLPLRWVDARRWHVTLTFCGQVPESVVPDLSTRLGRAASRCPPLSLRFAGSGAFSRPARATVLWCGLAGDAEPLSMLAARTSAAARRCGITVDSRAFRPHLTLARSSRPVDLREPVAALASYDGPPWRAESVHLVCSTPTIRGPNYDTIDSYPLSR